MIAPTISQQYQRLKELFGLSRQRYLEDGGDPHHPASANVYLTPEEQQEFKNIARMLATKPTNLEE
jgi:hypothetical protein